MMLMLMMMMIITPHLYSHTADSASGLASLRRGCINIGACCEFYCTVQFLCYSLTLGYPTFS